MAEVDYEGNAPAVQMPDAVQINTPTTPPPAQMQSPSATVAAQNKPLNLPANLPTINAPSVTPAPGVFDPSTEAISDLIKAKQAELNANTQAIVANRGVDQSAYTASQSVNTEMLNALNNINKANALPGGPDGGIARIFSLFDSDYNKNIQNTNLEAAKVKSQSITATAAAIKEQNNLIPSLYGKVSQAQQDIINAQNERNKLVLQQGQLTVEQTKARMEAIETSIHMSQEARAATEFKLKGVDTDAMPALIAQAKTGKGPWAGKVGLLQDAYLSKQQVETNLAKAQEELAKGNHENYQKFTTDAAANLPPDYLAGQIQKATASHSAFVEIPQGEIDPKTKQPIMQQIPIGIANAGLIQGQDLHNKASTALAADLTDRLNIIPNVTNIVNGAQALVATDPRATQILGNANVIMKNMNGTDPASVSQTGTMLKQLNDQWQGIVKENAALFQTPAARAAYEQFGQTGKFNTQGGTAVAAESVGIPSLTGHSLFKDAWALYGRMTAQQVNAEHIGTGTSSASGVDGNISGADAMQMLSQALQRNQGREKITSIGTNILADPIKAKAIGQRMTMAIQGKIMNDTLQGLSQQKDAPPIWGDLFQHTEQLLDGKGQLDYSKLATKLEMASIKSGGKTNFTRALLGAMRNYSANAENISGSDPSYTDKDRALEAAIFGHNPYRALTEDLLRKLTPAAVKQHQEMQARIQQDVTGKTQRDAVMSADPLFQEQPGMRWENRDKIAKHTGVNMNQVPSATGIEGMTADQIAQMYARGY